jgi:hypothetical protein
MSEAKPDTLPTFVLKAPTSFWWTVRIPTATDTDYSYAKLDVLFAALPQAELDKMRGAGLAEGDQLPSEDDIARRVVKGWRHLPDENGDAVPFSHDKLEQLLAVPMVRTHIVATYMAATSGMAARKNA